MHIYDYGVNHENFIVIKECQSQNVNKSTNDQSMFQHY